MSDLPPIRLNIQTDESRYRSAVSEALAQKLGGSINFINKFQKYDKHYCLNGQYNILSLPFAGVDGMFVLPDDAIITDAAMYVKTAGNSGYTSVDCLSASAPGATFTSIFTTVPQITSAAGNFSWCYTGASIPNTTAPVIASTATVLPRGSAIRGDLIHAQGGTPLGCGLIIYVQPH